MKPYPPERKAEVLRLREEGLGYLRISKATGVPWETVRRWVKPGYAESHQALVRRLHQRYRGTCERCGGPTSSCRGPGKAPPVCVHCRGPELSAARIGRGPVIEKVLAYCAEPKRRSEIARHVDRPYNNISVLLNRALKNGQLVRVARGVYVVPQGSGSAGALTPSADSGGQRIARLSDPVHFRHAERAS